MMVSSKISDLKDCKFSKMYSYFKNGWINKTYAAIGLENCLLKTNGRPSERLRPVHKLALYNTKTLDNWESLLHLHGIGSDDDREQRGVVCSDVRVRLFNLID